MRFASIIDFSQKNQLLSGSSKVKRPGLIDHNTIFKNPYYQMEKLILSYSSGEESENEEESEHFPGIKDVIENMWDHNTIQQVVSSFIYCNRTRIGEYRSLRESGSFSLTLTSGCLHLN